MFIGMRSGSYDEVEIPYHEMRAEVRAPAKVGAVSYAGMYLSRSQLLDWMNSPDGRNEVHIHLYCVTDKSK